MEWVRQNKTEFTAQTRAAVVGARIVSHMVEKGADQIRPEIVALIQGLAPRGLRNSNGHVVRIGFTGSARARWRYRYPEIDA